MSEKAFDGEQFTHDWTGEAASPFNAEQARAVCLRGLLRMGIGDGLANRLLNTYWPLPPKPLALEEMVDGLSIEDLRAECKRMHRYVAKCLAYPPWPIPVTERLPANEPCGNGRMKSPSVQMYDPRCGWYRGSYCVESGRWYFDSIYCVPEDNPLNVTHWLPLPPKPE